MWHRATRAICTANAARPVVLAAMVATVAGSVEVTVSAAGTPAVNGVYGPRNPKHIPAGFRRTCDDMGWNTDDMWNRLSDGQTPWYESDNGSYIYRNTGDGK